MKADAFVRHLQRAKPDRATLEEYGLDEEEIEEIESTFTASRRLPHAEGVLSEAVRMVVEFDCAKLEVGPICFNGEPRPLAKGVCFAVCEADPLMVVDSGAVVLCDHEEPERVQLACAADAERFLDALARFVTVRQDRERWMGKVEEASALCAEAAGGASYSDFYRMLCAFLHREAP